MKRGEERQQAAKDYCHNLIGEATFGQFVAHMAGSKWADEHPVNYDGKAMLYVNNKSHENGYNEAVDKACEWLRVELDKEEERHYIHVHGFDKERREIFLEDFKQAMKGE